MLPKDRDPMMSHQAETREGERVGWEIASRSKERDGFMQESSEGLLPTKAAKFPRQDEAIAASCLSSHTKAGSRAEDRKHGRPFKALIPPVVRSPISHLPA